MESQVPSDSSLYSKLQDFHRDILILAGCMVFAFTLRIIPVLIGTIVPGHYLPYDPDVLYHLRQVEIMVHNFPVYPWFDPMTYYPSGRVIQWGPLYTLLGAIASLITGAVEKHAILATVSWLPPFLFTLVIPVTYGIGRIIQDRMSGLIAAICLTIMPGMIFSRSYFGHFDHHILEVLSTSAFVLFYLIALKRAKEPDHSLYSLMVPASAAGVCYAAAVMTIPIVCIYALITLLFTILLILYALKQCDIRIVSDLIFLNIGAFFPAVIALGIIGIQSSEISLNGYSILQPGLYIGICLIAPAGYIFHHLLRKSFIFAIIISASGTLAILGLIYTIYPGIIDITGYHLRQLMLVTDLQTTISEAGPWNLWSAVSTYQGGLLLVLVGLFFLIKKIRCSFQASDLYLLISAFVLIVATFQHWRFEYYLGAIFAILIAIPIAHALSILINVLNSEEIIDVWEKTSISPIKKGFYVLHSLLRSHSVYVILLLTGGFFLIGGLTSDLSWHPQQLNPDMDEVLFWMGKNTPDPGYNPYQIYNEKNFTPPEQSYGVISWWNNGHAITEIAGRIPYTNPFQQGTFLVAMFLCDNNEESATSLLSSIKGRYVITDSEMISIFFPSIETWNPARKEIQYFFQSEDGGVTSLITPAYYLSLAPRLHIYDGSMVKPEEVLVATYRPDPSMSESNPMLGSLVSIDSKSYPDALIIQNESKKPGEVSLIGQIDISQPSVPIAALRHFRLVYESHTSTDSGITVNDTPARTFSFAKVFEYVPGARISGNGTATLSLRTNTGRLFEYQQRSINGLFILPYRTDGCSGEICPTGPYRILETNQTITVSEDQIFEIPII
ncbi:MAG TPA: oligosaccharyl transferase, archaeosortase A system-associated [Methanospirillum sp.]|nr:oligosaccharyl transferase, archaeosortase A system-associated [Methanospirillum sp.]